MSRVAIFIDGAHVSFMLRDEFASTRIDFDAFAKVLAGDLDLLRTYYYDCPPYQSSTPSDDEKQRFAGAQRFFTALNRLPRYEVRLGRLAYRGLDGSGKPIFMQKRVDIMLGVDLALLAGKNQITHAILVAG
ncbi:MAG: NYN domain-containing protein, partial [Chloroflexi bacterium]|nr:NYN domain-containing protein [Chloroflexota bacterium]